MEQIPFSEAKRRLAAKAIPIIFRAPDGPLTHSKNPSFVAAVSQISSACINTTHFFMIYFNFFHPTRLFIQVNFQVDQ